MHNFSRPDRPISSPRKRSSTKRAPCRWFATTSRACWRASSDCFPGRGYNIESLTVSETEHEAHISRITIVTRGTPHVLEQIKHQLERIVPVHAVVDLSLRAREKGQEKPLERELALVKVRGEGDHRVEALRLADAFRAQVIDANAEHFIFEITGRVSKIEQFISIMRPLGLVEVCRTGVAAVNRGSEGL